MNKRELLPCAGLTKHEHYLLYWCGSAAATLKGQRDAICNYITWLLSDPECQNTLPGMANYRPQDVSRDLLLRTRVAQLRAPGKLEELACQAVRDRGWISKRSEKIWQNRWHRYVARNWPLKV